ncbi:MAG: MFS transporter [Rhodospirillales bacterium 70-18]|nr:MFS transporter [Rhodospirillales bacterium]OJY70429.1 MAG: MFS transporter [Rhodospirillales bacterium 70-18]
MTRPRWLVVGALGCAQILAWGASYYLIAVLAKPIGDQTGWPLGWIIGGLSGSFLVSGLVSPRVGGLIDRLGGRPVLASSAVLLAIGLALLAVAPNIPMYVFAWAVMGVGMGAGLYDPAFATLGRLYGEQARSAITMTTLYGGFASTVCWPLSALLVEQVGWRGACLAYAGIMLAVVLPLYWFGLPKEPATAPPPRAAGRAGQVVLTPRLRLAFWMLALNLTLASVVMTVVSVHLLTLLQTRGIELAAAVGLGALIGPAQVGARVVEMLIGRNRHPVWTLLASTLLAAAGLGLIFGDPAMVAVGLVLYGSGSGIRSIARGTVPLALFGREGYATLMGRLAMPTLIAQAAAPSAGAWLLEALGANAMLLVLVAGAVLNIATSLPLLGYARER